MLTRVDIKHRSLRSLLVSWFLKRQFKPKLVRPDFDPVRLRKALDRDMGKRKPAAGVRVDTVTHADVRGEWNTPGNNTTPRVILYCHGGGYLFGSPLSYRAFTTQLARATDTRVFVLDYRLAPEHPFPAAADDVLRAYRWLLKTTPPERIILAGDSAGGGLSLSLLVQIRQQGLPMPSAAVLLSPYTDLQASGASLDTNSDTCAMFSGDAIRRAASLYLAGADALDTRASPLYTELTGFPPMLIYVSDSEVLRDDGLRIAEKAGAAGVDVQLRVWRGQPHVWPLFAPLLPEANTVLNEIADYCRHH